MHTSTSVNTLAIFGATGRTGSETLKSLLASPQKPAHIKIYVRSRQKLLSLVPDLKTGGGGITILEGQVTDVASVKECLDGADTIICALGENDNKPSVRVLQDASRTIVAALKQLKDASNDCKTPRLLLLSSSTWNERFAAKQPAAVMWMIKNAFYYPYADLQKAHQTFQGAEAEGMLRLLLVQPPAIIEEEASGHQVSVEEVGLTVSYADLGAAFVELATEAAYRDVTAIGVTSKNAEEGFSRYGPEILFRVVKGLMASYLPGFWLMNGVVNKVLG